MPELVGAQHAHTF